MKKRIDVCQGVQGAGRDYFAKVVAAGQEGLVAKRLSSPYVPGKRASAWRKIKPVQELACVVVGYRPGPGGLKDLLLAAVREGLLRYVGMLEVGVAAGRDLLPWLMSRQREKPVVPCPLKALWVDPTRICKVRCHGWRPGGAWRDPMFVGWVDSA